MKTQSGILLLTLLVFAALTSMAQGIDFEHSSWEEVRKKARFQNKYIFVDFYATWCGPCKYMSSDIFTKEDVGAFFNANFISFKVDAEKEEEALVESIGLEAYPTLVFFNPDGEIFYQHIGAADGDQLIALGESVVSYRSNQALVDQGKATREQLFAYLRIARTANPENYSKAGKEVLTKATPEDLHNADVWSIITSELKDVNHPLFKVIIANAKTLSDAYENGYIEYVDGVLSAHLEAMAEANDLAGLDVYKNAMAALYAALVERRYEYGYFDLQTNAMFYLRRNEMEAYGKTLISLVDVYLMGDAEKLSEYALELSSRLPVDQFGEKALAWAIQASALEKNKSTIYTLAVVYERIGDKEKAIECARDVLEFDLDDEERVFLNNYLQKLQS